MSKPNGEKGMLVLSRHAGQKIQIGDDIMVTLIGPNRHGQQRIGISAPDHVKIVRTELLERDRNHHRR